MVTRLIHGSHIIDISKKFPQGIMHSMDMIILHAWFFLSLSCALSFLNCVFMSAYICVLKCGYIYEHQRTMSGVGPHLSLCLRYGLFVVCCYVCFMLPCQWDFRDSLIFLSHLPIVVLGLQPCVLPCHTFKDFCRFRPKSLNVCEKHIIQWRTL